MNVKQLEILLSVVELGSFVKVATLRDVNASSISRSMDSLEQTLGFKLFKRSTRQLQLTEAGRVYTQKITPVLTQLLDAENQARDATEGLKGLLRVTLPLDYGDAVIVPLIPKFKQFYPEIELELLITDRCLNLQKDQIDVGIRLGSVNDESVVARPLSRINMKMCIAPTLLVQNPILSPQDLITLTCLHFIESRSKRVSWKITSTNNPLHQPLLETITFEKTMLSTTTGSVKALCEMGLGVALLPEWVVKDALTKGCLIELLPGWQSQLRDEKTQAWCFFPSKDYLPQKTRVFVDFLLAEFKGRR